MRFSNFETLHIHTHNRGQSAICPADLEKILVCNLFKTEIQMKYVLIKIEPKHIVKASLWIERLW